MPVIEAGITPGFFEAGHAQNKLEISKRDADYQGENSESR